MAAAHDGTQGQSRASAISNLVVSTMRRHTGRGPTRAKTYLNDDCAVVVLKDTMLVAERTLVDGGHAEAVLDMRRKFQQAMREPFVAGVERITGREVVAFMSDNHVEPDMAVETFVFKGEDRDDGTAWSGTASS